jgi:hypothetical protein
MRIAKRYLKKQSQFLKGQNDVKSILTMVYGDFSGPRRRKNKANSKHVLSAVEWANLQNTSTGRMVEAQKKDAK